MSKKFFTLSSRKIHGKSNFNHAIKYLKREVANGHVDLFQSSKNIMLSDFKYAGYDDYLEKKRLQIKNYNFRFKPKSRHRMIQKRENKEGIKDYRSFCTEYVFSYSHGALNSDDGLDFLRELEAYIRLRFESQEIIISIIHRDQTTNHLHIIVSMFNKKKCQFLQRELAQEKKQILII